MEARTEEESRSNQYLRGRQSGSRSSMNGKWAIITGASSGIGKALAFEFAAGGFNVFLTARNGTALAEIAAECASKYGVETEIVSADLACMESIDELIAALGAKERHYDVLVNNAGFGVHGNFA